MHCVHMVHTVHVSCVLKLRARKGCVRVDVLQCHCALCISDLYECMHMCECILYFHCVCLACQCTGSTAKIGERDGWHALAARLTPSGVCCHFSGEVRLTRCKWRRQQRRTGTVLLVCGFLCVCWERLSCFNHVYFLQVLRRFSWVL